MFMRFPVVLLSALMLGACGQAPTRPDPNPAHVAAPGTAVQPEFPGPNDNLNAVAWTQTSIERDLIYRQTYRAAGSQLDRALAEPGWEALASNERKIGRTSALKPAVILDIDETVLDNSPYQARLVVDGTNYDEFTWSEWCREENAAALQLTLTAEDITRLERAFPAPETKIALDVV